MMDFYYGNMFGWGFGGGFMMVLFWAVIIFFIVWMVKEIKGENHADDSRHKSAVDILKERYANGEIDKKEFEEKKKDIEK